jgi:thiol-disulfide isomerase/thioredoxin
MKLIIQICFYLLFSVAINAQGIQFFEGSWDEALIKSKTDNKMIFVDAFTKWCGPCKRLQNTVFTTKEAGDFYNQNFINFKIDMETQAGIEFGVKYPVGAYPTLFYINHKGEVVYSNVGSPDVQRLIELGKKAILGYNDSPELEKEWDNGNRDYDLVLKYVKSLVLKSKPANKIVFEYLKPKPDITKEQKVVLIFESTSECDSRLFEMMTEKQNMKLLSGIYSKNEISDKIYNVCWKTVEKSYQFEVPALQDEAKEKMKKFNNDRCSEFISRIELFNAENTGDISLYKRAAKNYFNELKDSETRIRFIEEIAIIPSLRTEITELKLSLSKITFEKDKKPATYLNYIKTLIDNKNYSDAREHLGKAIKMATDMQDSETLRNLKRFEVFLQRSDSEKN